MGSNIGILTLDRHPPRSVATMIDVGKLHTETLGSEKPRMPPA
jgi:hypothetical protein